MEKLTQDQIEAKIVMQTGSLTQDLKLAQEVMKDAGMDMSSPVAPITMNFVLMEIRKIRFELENPNPMTPFLTGILHGPITSVPGVEG